MLKRKPRCSRLLPLLLPCGIAAPLGAYRQPLPAGPPRRARLRQARRRSRSTPQPAAEPPAAAPGRSPAEPARQHPPPRRRRRGAAGAAALFRAALRSRPGWPPPIRSRWMRAWRFSPRAARQSMPRSPCRRCSAWSSRKAPVSAAAPFFMYYDARTRQGERDRRPREGPRRAPRRTCSWMSGQPMPSSKRCAAAARPACPGAIAMLYTAHAKFGALRWKELFEPAIRAASEGFQVPAAPGDVPRGRLALSAHHEIRSLFSRPDGELAAGRATCSATPSTPRPSSASRRRVRARSTRARSRRTSCA